MSQGFSPRCWGTEILDSGGADPSDHRALIRVPLGGPFQKG